VLDSLQQLDCECRPAAIKFLDDEHQRLARISLDLLCQFLQTLLQLSLGRQRLSRNVLPVPRGHQR